MLKFWYSTSWQRTFLQQAFLLARIRELSQCGMGTVWPILQMRLSNLPCDLGTSQWQHWIQTQVCLIPKTRFLPPHLQILGNHQNWFLCILSQVWAQNKTFIPFLVVSGFQRGWYHTEDRGQPNLGILGEGGVQLHVCTWLMVFSVSLAWPSVQKIQMWLNWFWDKAFSRSKSDARHR